MKKITAIVLLLCASRQAPAAAQAEAAPDARRLYAWYREDGIRAQGNQVTAWSSAAGVTGEAKARTLGRVVGSPTTTRVKTPGGERSIVSLDGRSALWEAVQQWGALNGERSVIVLARLPVEAEGFLFDGSANTGLSRAQVRGGSWQAGVQPPPISNATKADGPTLAAKFGLWQVHAFSFRPGAGATEVTHSVDGASKTARADSSSGLSGFILGANAGTGLGLRCQVAEVLVYERFLSPDEVVGATKYLQGKWGSLEPAQNESQAGEAVRAAIAARLADRSKPMVWVFAGARADEKAPGQWRSGPQHFAERVRWEMNRRRDIVIDTRLAATPNATLNAAPSTEPNALARDFEARVARFRPAVVVLSPSAGDDVAGLLARVHAIGAIPVLQLGPGADVASARAAAADPGALLVDPASPTASAAQAGTAQHELASAVALFRALGIDDPQSPTVRRLQK